MEEVAVVGRYDHERLIPRFLSFDPVKDSLNGFLAAEHSSDRTVDVVSMIGPINVTRFHHQPKALLAFLENFDGRGC